MNNIKLFFDYNHSEVWKGMILWRKLVVSIILIFFEIIKQPKFVFFSLVSIAIGTCGIWIQVVFDFNLSIENMGLKSAKFQNFPFFTYNLSVLGFIAAEHFIKKNDSKGDESESLKSFSMAVWVVALGLSFWALKQPIDLTWHLILAFWITLSIWMSVNINNDEFITDTNASIGSDIASTKKSAIESGKNLTADMMLQGDGLNE